MSCGHWQQITHAEAGKIRHGGGLVQSIDLVGDHHDLARRTSQQCGNFLVFRHQPVPCTDDKQDQFRLVDCLVHLLCCQVVDALCVGNQATGIDQQAWSFADPGNSILTIPGNARYVRNQRVTRSRQGIEQCGFANVWPSDYGDYG